MLLMMLVLVLVVFLVLLVLVLVLMMLLLVIVQQKEVIPLFVLRYPVSNEFREDFLVVEFISERQELVSALSEPGNDSTPAAEKPARFRQGLLLIKRPL